METLEATVNREPRRLDEVLDRDDLRTLVHDREAREAADRLVNLLQLARGELLTTPQPDRVAADDVVAGDHPCQRLGPAPFVRVDRRFGGDRILLERTDADAETAVVLDREADERTGPNAVRRRPVLREGYAEARISQLLDLPGFQFHDPCKYGTPPNTYAVRPWPPPPMASRLLPALDRGHSLHRCPSVPIESSQSLMSLDGIGPKQMDRQVDVLVVGAGPTGSTAAKYAALGGADVLLIEKRSEIGTPVRCGEGVAKRWLEEIGLAPSREFICHEVDGARIIAPDGTALVLDETRAIDACLQYPLVGVEGDPRLNDFYLGSCAPGGYAWVFWKDSDVANVGIGVNLSKIRERADAKKYLDRLIERTPGLARGEIVEEVAGAVSVSMPLERTVAPGVMLAGDAARLIDPLTGGGILNGCLSGRYAGEGAAGGPPGERAAGGLPADDSKGGG